MRRRSIERESESDGITNHRGKLPALAGIIGDSSAVTSGHARPDACSIDDQKRARPGRTLAQARGSRERRDEPLARVHSRLVKLRVVPHFFPTSRCTGIVTSIRLRRSAVPCRITRSPFRARTTTEVARLWVARGIALFKASSRKASNVKIQRYGVRACKSFNAFAISSSLTLSLSFFFFFFLFWNIRATSTERSNGID